MAFDPDRVSAVTFDSYSTVVDVSAAAEALAPYTDEPAVVSRHWRLHSILYSLVGNFLQDAYEPFYELNRKGLDHALATYDLDLETATREEILAVYHELDVFDDVQDGMARLSEEYDLYIVSNGNPEMLDAMVDHADIGAYVSGTISADEVERYKPAPELYRHAAARTGTPVDEIAHATAGWFDVQGGMNVGMQGVWVDRGSEPWVPFDGEPDLTVETFTDLADELGV